MPRLGGQPIFVLSEGTERRSGKDAQSTNISVGKTIADSVRSTLGPKGMDKMLVDDLGDIVITNDGATILDEMDVEHPVAKMMVEVAQTQDEEIGDGTTTAVVLSGELLKEAEDLLDQNIHPTVIIKGYNLASKKAMEELEKMSVELGFEDDERLQQVAMTAMTGKGVEKARETLAKTVVNSVKQVADRENGEITIDTDYIKVEKKQGGDMEDTKLIDGIAIDKEKVHPNMPKKVEDAKVALLNSPIEVKETETDAEINISSPDQLQEFLDQEENMLKEMVQKVEASGANVVFCQKGIDDAAQHFLAKKGILAIRRVKKSDMEKLSRATDGNVVTNLNDLGEEDLGYAGKISERSIGDEDMTFIEDCKDAKSVTVILRGGTEHVIDEAERAVHDAVGVVCNALEEKMVVAGGGSPEVKLSLALKEYASKVGGREQLAINRFAKALEIIPRTLAESAGMDPIDTLVDLRSKHEGESKSYGINVVENNIADMESLHVLEPTKIKKQATSSATSVAEMILRIDDVISTTGGGGGDEGPGGAPPAGGPPAGGPPGAGGMPGGLGGMM